MNDEELLGYNGKGIIPGPEESEEDYLLRADYCLRLKDEMEDSIPLAKSDLADKKVLEEAFSVTRKWMDIAPDWIPLYFSNYKLAPWHGGCAWIFQLEENHPASAFFQLRKGFKTKEKQFGYTRKEILAHELSHVGRMLFEEPRFEELLAYRTSPSKFRRWFGPIIQSASESMLFVIVLILLFFVDLSVLFVGDDEAFRFAMWLKAIPLGLIVLALVRLARKHWTFSGCRENLSKISPKNADAMIYRLTDQEIQKFSQMNSDAIRLFADSDTSLRWRLIKKAYL